MNSQSEGWKQRTQMKTYGWAFSSLSCRGSSHQSCPSHGFPLASLCVTQGTLPSGTSSRLLSSCHGLEVLASLDGLYELTVLGEQSDL